MSLLVYVLVGIPASSKSTWARNEIAKDPLNFVRINNDDLRASFNGSVWGSEYEGDMIKETRKFLITQALKSGKNVIVDNLNLAKKNWGEILKAVREANVDAILLEKPFYVELEEAVERDSKRTGKECVGRKVIEKWWKESGKEQFKHYKPRTETITARPKCDPPAWINGVPTVLISDIDGTYAVIGQRNPYDAKDSDLIDLPNKPLISIIGSLRDSCLIDGVIYCSGREDKYRPETRRFIDKYGWFDERSDQLLMRASGDKRPDDVVKEEIYNNHIKGKYNVLYVFDDRLKVCRMWYRLGLNLYRLGDPESSF